MLGAEVPLLDQGSVQFILFTLMIIVVAVDRLGHDREVSDRGARGARPPRSTSATTPRRCS